MGRPQTVDKVYFCDLCCKSLAEFRRPQTAEERRIVFSGGVYVGKHTSQATSVRAKASARSGLHPPRKNACIFEKRVEVFRHAKPAAEKILRRALFIAPFLLSPALWSIDSPKRTGAAAGTPPERPWSRTRGDRPYTPRPAACPALQRAMRERPAA